MPLFCVDSDHEIIIVSSATEQFTMPKSILLATSKFAAAKLSGIYSDGHEIDLTDFTAAAVKRLLDALTLFFLQQIVRDANMHQIYDRLLSEGASEKDWGVSFYPSPGPLKTPRKSRLPSCMDTVDEEYLQLVKFCQCHKVLREALQKERIQRCGHAAVMALLKRRKGYSDEEDSDAEDSDAEDSDAEEGTHQYLVDETIPPSAAIPSDRRMIPICAGMPASFPEGADEKIDDGLQAALIQSELDAIQQENANFHKALVLSKDVKEIVLLQLSRRTKEVVDVLLECPSLTSTRACVAEQGCHVAPEWANGAILLVPLTEAQFSNIIGSEQLKSHHILALRGDVQHIKPEKASASGQGRSWTYSLL